MNDMKLHRLIGYGKDPNSVMYECIVDELRKKYYVRPTYKRIYVGREWAQVVDKPGYWKIDTDIHVDLRYWKFFVNDILVKSFDYEFDKEIIIEKLDKFISRLEDK